MRWRVAVLLILPLLAGALPAGGEGVPAPAGVTLLTLAAPIDPITARYLVRGIGRAAADRSALVVIALDTPGGLEVSMDQIVQAILASPVPVVVYVWPSGARAASAGVFIAAAAEIVAMAPATHIGAAHPVTSSGGDISGTMGTKVLNDMVAKLKSLAELRGRSPAWADEAVRRSLSLTDTEAVRQGVADLSAPDLAALLGSLNGRSVKTPAGTITLDTAGAPVRRFDFGILERFLDLLVNPNLAYILLVIGIFGIIFELKAPGIGAPGIAGGIALLLALIGFGSLPTNFGGLALIALAIALFIVDIKVPSHGVWTAGGIVSFLLGSFLLFPPWRPPSLPSAPALRISPVTISAMTALISLFFIFVVSKGIAAQSRKLVFGAETIEGSSGTALTDLGPDGMVRLAGETWSARATEGRIPAGALVVVVDREGLRLIVRRKDAAM